MGPEEWARGMGQRDGPERWASDGPVMGKRWARDGPEKMDQGEAGRRVRPSRWQTANGLDVVAIGVEHKGTVVIGVIVRPQSRRPVVFAPSLERRRIEGINGIAILGHEGEMHASLDGFTAADPELRPSLGAKARLACSTRLLGGDLHHEVITQRGQSQEIEGLRALVVGNWNA